MLGERMPRRPPYAPSSAPLLERIKEMFVDPRTWGSMMYMLLMLPLGIFYFTAAVTLLATSLSLIVAPVLALFEAAGWFDAYDIDVTATWWQMPFVFLGGVVLLFGTLHLARGIGKMHGLLAKHLLVRSGPQYVG